MPIVTKVAAFCSVMRKLFRHVMLSCNLACMKHQGARRAGPWMLPSLQQLGLPKRFNLA